MKIFYDVDTQIDFMNEKGALYVPGAELIKPNLRLLTDFAKTNFVPVLGSVDIHFGTPEYKEREGELAKYDGPFPDHCMHNTRGQLKIFETALKLAGGYEGFHDYGRYIRNWLIKNITREQLAQEWKETGVMDPIKDRERFEKTYEWALTGIDQDHIGCLVNNLKKTKEKKLPTTGIYFEKQSYDVFTNPNTEVLLARANVDEAIVYGVATDYCVKAAVLGMQDRGIQTHVVTDAIEGVDVNPGDSKRALDEMVNAGAKLVTTQKVLEGRL